MEIKLVETVIRQTRTCIAGLSYYRSMSRTWLSLDAELLGKVSELVGPADVVEYVERAIHYEIRRVNMGQFLDEFIAETGPLSDELMAEAEAFWYADEPSEDEVTPTMADIAGPNAAQRPRKRLRLEAALLTAASQKLDPGQSLVQFVELAIHNELRQGDSGRILAQLEDTSFLLDDSDVEDEETWHAG